MAIKIKKNGVVQDLVINANEVRVLDTDGNFRSKNLESVLKELNATGGTGTGGGSSIPKEADYVFVADSEPSYDGVWLDTSEDCTGAVEGDNGIVKAIRDYIDTDVKATVENNRKLVQENNKIVKDIQINVGEILDVVPQLSNPNLLINGDFQVWQRGNNFNITKDGKYNYTADRWVVQTDSDGIIVSPVDDGCMRVDMSKFKGTYTNVIQFLELSFYKKLIGKTVTIKIKFKNEVSNIAIGLRAFPDASATHTLINETASEFTITATIPKCSVECTKFMVYIQSKTQQILDFEYIKMELGNVATPFIPRLYSEELALCQRYYYQWFNERVRYRADGVNNNQLIFVVPLPTTMRTAPTLNNSFVINQIGGSPVSGFTFDCVNSPIGLRIYATKSNHGMSDGQLMTSDNRSLDSEIY